MRLSERALKEVEEMAERTRTNRSAVLRELLGVAMNTPSVKSTVAQRLEERA